jgi:hypothetical protein
MYNRAALRVTAYSSIMMVLSLSTFASIICQYVLDHKAYADGLSVENLPPTSLAGL